MSKYWRITTIIVIAGVVFVGGLVTLLNHIQTGWEPIMVTVHCDGEKAFEVTPPSHLNSYYPSLHIQDNIKGISWYDGTNAKHWVDVSHCSIIQIKPWKIAG